MNDGNDFGRQLRLARTRRGATQRQLADLSTVSVRAIRDLETGRAQRPRPETVRLIADGLGLCGRARSAFELSAGGLVPPDDDRSGAFLGPPAALDSMLGRERDAAVLRELLISGDQRLVTMVGVGGVGKTRLAQHVAAELHESGRLRVCWVADRDSVDVVSGMTDPGLLVLDHRRPGHDSARLVAMLAECPSLRMLVTARAPLEVPGERTYPLAPLPVPVHGGPAGPTEAPALALLIRCIRQTRPDYRPDGRETAALAALCCRLDGIPSALQAAARWLLVLEPAELLDQVRADPFTIVGNDLLSEPLRVDAGDRELLRGLAEIDGPWSITDVVARTGAPLAACHRLVHRLAVRGAVARGGHPDGPRFRLLELVRAGYRTKARLAAEA